MTEEKKAVGIIGGGVSGLAWADVLGRLGFEVTVLEREPSVGGQWLHSYPEVTLQNTENEYVFPTFPWPSRPHQHPTGEEILAYLRAAVSALHLKVKTGHRVLSAEFHEDLKKWRVTAETASGGATFLFDKLVASIGQYTDGKRRPDFPGQEFFQGRVVTERDVKDLRAVFTPGARVAVVGFGKSALDMATMAAANGARVQHLFRQARWTAPRTIGKLHSSYLLFSRANGTFMMPSWDHPSGVERFVHARLPGVVDSFWSMLQGLFRLLANRAAKGLGPEARARIERVLPVDGVSLPFEFRSAFALTPDAYFSQVARGEIEPILGQFTGFTRSGGLSYLGARGEETLPAPEILVLALGVESPVFPFLPAEARARLEAEPDGPQLFRHLVAPEVHPESLAFAGFNHGFLHIPSAYLGALWTGALWRGDFRLPPVAEMNDCVNKVQSWKRANILFEPSRSCAVNTRFQQYNDMLCAELGLSPWRKLPNLFAEALGRYGAADYAEIIEEYLAARSAGAPLEVRWDRYQT